MNKMSFVDLIESMETEIACELSVREEATYNGFNIVVEERRCETGRRGQIIVDGKEMSFEEACTLAGGVSHA